MPVFVAAARMVSPVASVGLLDAEYVFAVSLKRGSLPSVVYLMTASVVSEVIVATFVAITIAGVAATVDAEQPT